MGARPPGSDQAARPAGPHSLARATSSSCRRSPASPVSEFDRLEQELSRTRQELEFKSLLLDNATDSIVAHDLTGHLVYLNEAAATQMGYPREELLGRHLPTLLSIPEDAFAARVQLIRERGQAIFESQDRCADGGFRQVEVHGRVLITEKQVLVCSVSRDVSERKQAEETIERLAYHDPLTGLANRRLLDDRLFMALAHVRRSGEPLAIVYADIDKFKTINDSLGHGLGDQVIQVIAECLTQAVREGDTVARFGGDEFVLLLLDAGEEEALRVAERVLRALRESVAPEGEPLNLALSLGIAISPEGDDPPEDLLERADLAMFAAKQSGGNCYRLHQPDMTTAAMERFRLRNDLRDAFARGEFRLYYQPVLRLSDGVVVGAEALLRWRHPDLGEVSPTQFIPLAEETGLILALGAWVLKQACGQAQAWRQAGVPLERMAVNVSGRQLLQGDLVTDVRAALAASGLQPDCLEIEITEGVALADFPAVREVLAGVHRLGVSIAIDDFGAGHSSFNRICNLPIQTLKIDRSFIAGLANGDWVAIVQTIMDLGRALGLEIVAEGVETQEQMDLLKGMDCAKAQGFLFSRAVPPEEFPRLVRRREGQSWSEPASSGLTPGPDRPRLDETSRRRAALRTR